MPPLHSVLLVDDDPTTNFLNGLLLQRLNVTERVLVAENGQQALAVLGRECPSPAGHCPCLVLLDLNMPVMNGLEFLDAFLQLPPAQRAGTVVAVLTTSVHPRDLSHVQASPIAGVLTKPLTEAQVRELLHTHFPSA